MRVLQLGRFWNHEYGGIERHAALLSRSLAARRIDVVNLVAASPGMPGSEQWMDNYRLVQARSFGLFARTAISPALISKAQQLHREMPFDIIHLHFPDPLSHAAALALPRSVKRVITWHSDIFRQKKLLGLYLPMMQWFTCKADAVIASTQAQFNTSQQIPKQLAPEKRHVIPFAIDDGALTLTLRIAGLAARLREDAGGRPLIFALGRHVYYKGFDVLARAMADVDAQLLIGGSGPLHAQLQAQVDSLGLGHKVRLTGRIPEEQLAAYYHACDIFCLPSTEKAESFGLVQLEAMACGRPVVCTQLNNGVNEINPDGVSGLAVPPGDSAALAATLNRLIADAPLRLRLGERARERVRQNYTLAAMAAKHDALYGALLGQSSPRSADESGLATFRQQ